MSASDDIAQTAKLSFTGAVLMLVGGVLPWTATPAGITLELHSLGSVTAGLMVGVVTVVYEWTRLTQLAVCAVGALVFLIAAAALLGGPPAGTPADSTTPPVGAVLGLAGSVVVVVGGGLALLGRE